MNAFEHFPEHLHWDSHQLADAVPLRLHAVFAFDAERDAGAAANREPRRTRTFTPYAMHPPLPERFRIC